LDVEFKLDFDIEPWSKLDYRKKHLALGSCFAENIGRKLMTHRFDVLSNPFGTLYNPLSIARVLNTALDGKLDPNRLFESNNRWFSWDAASKVNASDQPKLLEILEGKFNKTHQYVSNAQSVIITFGSSWVYELNGELVANCHKQPANMFGKRLLGVQEVVEEWSAIVEKLPNTEFVFTVSPVRYTRDGLHESNVGKAVLHQAIHELVGTHSNAVYFPAYEIVVDELRDYRFFDRDLVHPNELAIDYVWGKFKAAMLNADSLKMVKDYTNLLRMVDHRLLFPDSPEAQKFTQKLTTERQLFEARYFGKEDITVSI